MRNKLHWMVRLACCSPLLGACAHLATPETAAVGVKLEAYERSSTTKAEGAYQLGRYYQAGNRLDLAVNSFRRALEADAGMVEARNGLGVALAMQGRYDEAIAALRSVAEQAPQAAHIQSNLGYALFLKTSYEEAISALEKAVALDPNNLRARNNLALSYAALELDQTATEPAVPNAVESIAQPAIGTELSLSPLLVGKSPLQLVELMANVYELREPAGPDLAARPTIPDTEVPVEVSNGNGVTGMARMVGHYIDGKGFQTLHRTNWKIFTLPVTCIEYRIGFRTQARQLAALLPGNPPALTQRSLRADVNLRVVLGKDLVKQVAAFGKPAKATLVASTDGAAGH